MKKINFSVQEPYKSMILNGEKTIEGRLNKGKFKDTKVGDILVFETGEEFIIIKKIEYKTFYQMLEKEGIEKIIPNKKNLLEATEVYYNFYSKKQEEEFGVVAIELKQTTGS